ncbi:Outer membrane protein assembly factor BamD,Tetratricopeptide repeat-containing, partial [Cinara cedri]
ELKEINGKLLKNKRGKIDETRREKLIEYNIRLENNTLLEVIHKNKKNKKYNYNTSPLILAVKSNLTEVAKAILSITGENLDIQDNEGMNVLHYAAKNNDKFIVDTLLQKKLQVDVKDKKGKTALHHAAENNCDSIVETLLQHGANINALDKDGRTPLFYALTKNHSTLATFIMTKGALLEIEDKDNNEETITNEEEKAEIIQDYIDQDYDGEYELFANTSLETSDAITTSEDEDPFDEQPTTSYNRNFDDSHKSFVEIPLPKSTLEENPPDEQSTASNVTHSEPRKHSWMPLRKVPKITLPSQPNETNEAKGTYKIVILVASAAAIITASMLTYFTTLPTLSIIGIAFASALVFGSITTLKPMSKMDDTDCSKLHANLIQKSETELYEEAVKLFNKEKYKQAIKVLHKIEDLYPLSYWAMQAKLLSGISSYNMGDYSSAANSMDEYIYIYPNSADLSYTYYLRILSYYMQIDKVQLGQQTAHKTLELAVEYTNLFPQSEYVGDVKEKIKLVTKHITEKEYAIGKFYFRRGEYLAAIKRFQNVINDKNSSYLSQSLNYLVTTHSAFGLKSEAEQYANMLTDVKSQLDCPSDP